MYVKLLQLIDICKNKSMPRGVKVTPFALQAVSNRQVHVKADDKHCCCCQAKHALYLSIPLMFSVQD